MGDFFRGWRRKAGLVTLIMVLAFMAGWMRSLSVADVIGYPGGDDTIVSFSSYMNSIVSHKTQVISDRVVSARTVNLFRPTHIIWISRPVTDASAADDICQWRFVGFEVFSTPADEIDAAGSSEVFWRIPYWSIIILPTLISAYLLLVKPRVAKSKPISLT